MYVFFRAAGIAMLAVTADGSIKIIIKEQQENSFLFSYEIITVHLSCDGVTDLNTGYS